MSIQPNLPDTGFVTREWVKKRYAISNATLHSWIANSRFPRPLRIGPRAVRFDVADLAAFEAACRKSGEP